MKIGNPLNSYMFKNLPAQYVFGGYAIRKGITSMTSDINGQVVYDVFLNTYVDDEMSFFILMEDGTYKSVSEDVKVGVLELKDLVSKHLERGDYVDTSKFPQYDKSKIFGVYGIKNINEILKLTEELDKNDDSKDISLSALIGEKAAYTGMEIKGIINRFNKINNGQKRSLLIPAVKNNLEDEYESKFGVEDDFINYFAEKTPEEFVGEIRKMVDELDAVGNKKYESLGL